MTIVDHAGTEPGPPPEAPEAVSLSAPAKVEDYHAFQRPLLCRALWAQSAVVVVMVCVAASALARMAIRLHGAVLHSRDSGGDLSSALGEAANADLAMDLVVAAILLLFGRRLAQGVGGFLHEFRAPPHRAIPGLVDGVSLGAQTARLVPGGLRSDMAFMRSDMHFAKLLKPRWHGGLIVVDRPSCNAVFFAPDGPAEGREPLMAALRRARRHSRRERGGWPVPAPDFAFAPKEVDAAVAEWRQRKGYPAPGFNMALLNLAIFSFLGVTVSVAVAQGLAEVEPPTLMQALLVATAILQVGVSRKLGLHELRYRLGLGPRILAAVKGVDAGPTALWFDRDGLFTERAFERTQIRWPGITEVMEIDGKFLLCAGSRVLEVVPALPELAALFPEVGLRPPGGPWGEQQLAKGRVWHAS